MTTLRPYAEVEAIYEAAFEALQSGRPIAPHHQTLYDVRFLLMECFSGASFEQYFRWAGVDEICRVVAALRRLSLDQVAELTEQAISVAFPKGVPASDDAKRKLTNWTPKQDKALRSLFKALEPKHADVMNVLSDFAKRES